MLLGVDRHVEWRVGARARPKGAARHVAAFLLVCAVAAAGPLDAQEQASVGGVVRDSAGPTLTDVTVSVLELERATRTDTSGRFRFAGIPAGQYVLEIRRLGYLPLRHDLVLRSGEAAELEFTLVARPVVIEQLVVRAPNTGLRGVVHNADLEPIANAEISTTSTSRRVRTGSDGHFTWTGFPSGSHLVRVTADGYAPRVFAVTIPSGEGRQVGVRLDITTRRRSNMDEHTWFELGRRRRWASSTLVTFLTDEQLMQGAAVRLSEDVRLRHAAGPNPCLRVNGRLSALPLDYFFVEEVAAVEVIPDGAVFGQGNRRRASPPVGRQLGGTGRSAVRGCTTQVYVWLK